MSKAFACSHCHYNTTKKSSFDDHLKSRRHICNIEITDDMCDSDSSDLDSESKCPYCTKLIKYKRNLWKHYKTCQIKTVYEEKQQLEKELLYIENTVKKEYDQQLEELEELREVKVDYYDLLRQIAKSKTSPQTINLHYIINNFTEAYNYEDLMGPELTAEDIEEIRELEPLSGTIHMIEKRCIRNIDIAKRPLHCLDISRNKYLVRTQDEWVVDHHAKRIFKDACKHLYDLYITDPAAPNITLDQVMKNQQKLLKLEAKTSQNKMIKDLNDKTYIKNIQLDNI